MTDTPKERFEFRGEFRGQRIPGTQYQLGCGLADCYILSAAMPPYAQ
jgi:hypothetical protein